ncbi:bifunctional GNAT family N-acetyltransferase/NUDIX hydrolase [Streptomyces sp. NBC_01601]|uniref:bifunctional GNAT family N-acetyltransferase/NUDIX hydrolase n=1 Tax=Streptomyces sp. NBC_01601 TaxID=2975892 RepID=UPI002E2C9475|nr:GNAT family N-acetyltransferase [Streptomyces sp. NBC_01601]
MTYDLSPARTPDPGLPDGSRVRPATPVDAEGIIRLRSAHILSEPMSEKWIRRCTAHLAQRLARDAHAFVVEDPDGAVVSCALGLVHAVLPARTYPKGLAARIHAVATHPGVRRRGYARAVLSALLDHLQRQGVTLFELHSSDEAAPLYRQLGFESKPALMRMTRLAEPEDAEEAGGTELWLPPAQYAESLPKATVFGCMYFTDEQGRPLQLHAVYSSTHPWQFVGGTTEHGERPWETAVRECWEETGIRVHGQPPLLAAVYGHPGNEWPYSTMGLVFDGGRLTDAQIDAITLNPGEHDEVRVLSLEEWKPLMPTRDFERLLAVAEARRTGRAACVAWDWGTK